MSTYEILTADRRVAKIVAGSIGEALEQQPGTLLCIVSAPVAGLVRFADGSRYAGPSA